MTRILLAVLLLGLAPSLVSAQTKPCRPGKHAKVPTIKGLTYNKARNILLSAGWQPFQTKSSEKAKTDPELLGGNALLFWQKGYVEVQVCSGTGLARCVFLFKDTHGSHLIVYTAGEELPEMKAEATVTGFDLP